VIFKREPALFLGAVQALLALGVGFGLHLTTVQMGLIQAAVAASSPSSSGRTCTLRWTRTASQSC
jgi:hypothetical protein